MMADATPLPWTPQQWASLRSIARDAARKSRVASTFLPPAGPADPGESTVPADWLELKPITHYGGAVRTPGSPAERIETISGKTLSLITVSCNLHLRGSEVADPDLDAVKSLVRRAASTIGRVEDALIFYGWSSAAASAVTSVQPEIYSISGGGGFTGLLDAPNLFAKRAAAAAKSAGATSGSSTTMTVAVGGAAKQAKAAGANTSNITPAPIVDSVIEAVQKLEQRGHFGPFAVVLGQDRFREATTPTNPSLVLPTDRIIPFLEGGPLLRSGVLNPAEGLVVALGGNPVELVLGSADPDCGNTAAADIHIDFLQRTEEARYVVRVYERFVLRIKELDAIVKLV
jgi:uncharacterized linocin/CFP29 family protein